MLKNISIQLKSDVQSVEIVILLEKEVNALSRENAIDVLRGEKMIEVELEDYTNLIKDHAIVALKKAKKPSKFSLDDLIQEGVIVFICTKNEYDVHRGASFKTIFTKRLRGHYTNLVRKSYRDKEISSDCWNSRVDDFSREIIPMNKGNSLGAFEIVQTSFIIDSFNKDEIEYIRALLSFAYKPRKSRRKATREYLGISYDRERELRASISDKIRK